MNKIETIVYGMVKNHPWMKKTIRTIYQGFFDLLPKEKEIFKGDFQYKEGYFFGFHDVSAFSPDESKILAHKTPFDGRIPKDNEPVEIGYFDFLGGKFGEFHILDKSFAWNYHKGCRLQWINNDKIIYNTAIEGTLVSKIMDVNTRNFDIIYFPIDAIYSSEARLIGTTFSYSRLNRCMPGYGYAIADEDYVEEAPQGSGLFIINLLTKKRELCISLEELAYSVGYAYRIGYTHFVTHSEFSKDGRYVSFLYRVAPIGKEGLDMHKTWILIYDLQSKSLKVLSTQESGSHYVWNDKNQIIASCVINGKSCHVLYDLDNLDSYKIVASDVLNSDGHQSFITNTKFVTDTYPDRKRMAKLYIVDTETSSAELVASIYSPKEFQTKDVQCHIACDLHPRVSPSKRYISFDSPRTGKRALYTFTLVKNDNF